MTTLWAGVLCVGDLQRLVVIDVRVDELLRAGTAALLQVQAAGIAKSLLGRGVATPQRSGGDMAMDTGLLG